MEEIKALPSAQREKKHTPKIIKRKKRKGYLARKRSGKKRRRRRRRRVERVKRVKRKAEKKRNGTKKTRRRRRRNLKAVQRVIAQTVQRKKMKIRYLPLLQ
jgi:hypothetical protein